MYKFGDQVIMHPYDMVKYMEFLETQCNDIKLLCQGMENDLAIIAYAMDDLNAKTTAMRLQRNIEAVRTNMPIYSDLYNRLALAVKLIKQL